MASVNSARTLLNRSQEILGVSLDEMGAVSPNTSNAFMNERSYPGQTTINASSGKVVAERKRNVSPSRRREQVAQAQRTRRQRTQRYIRALESEVLRLRKLEREIREQNYTLQERLNFLTNAKPIHDVPVADAQDVLTPVNTSDSATLDESGRSPAMLYIDLTGISSIEPEKACSDTAAERIPIGVDFSSLTRITAQSYAQLGADQDSFGNTGFAHSLSPAMFLDAQAGLDFVLELERPCLPHVKYAMMNEPDTVSPQAWKHNFNGPGHVFTATVSLLQESPMPHSFSHPFSVSQNAIDRLLKASKQLNLESEMTPVQMWQEIKDLSNAHPITSQLFVALTKDLCKYTFCNSFGTVIDKSVFNTILSHNIPSIQI